MLFTQIEFFIFFVIVICVVSMCKKTLYRNIFLLVASYYFYAYWDWRFLSLIIFSTIIDFFVGKRIYSLDCKEKSKPYLIVSIICNLGMLAFFKYCNFFIDTLSPVLSSIGLECGTLSIILPIGISFYTFQTMSYTIDIYRGKLKPCDRFIEFALFVSFFPQLVAGPIVRAKNLLPQIENPNNISRNGILKGGRQFSVGLFKKVFIADRVAYYVDYVFANTGVFDSLTVWVVIVTYSIQIYCDFSGYSDMAIGAARILGYRFKKNFDYPYISSSITEFWRRWHISLSSWLKDYVYFSLGGNRGSRRKTYTNILSTMLLGGLWHGAAWTFVFWGGLHGLALIVNKLFIDVSNFKIGSVYTFAGWLLTFLTVLVGWVFFRAQSFESAFIYLQRMFFYTDGIRWIHPFAVFSICVVFMTHLSSVYRPVKKLRYLPAFSIKTMTCVFTMLLLVVLFYPKGFKPFIYFQF